MDHAGYIVRGLVILAVQQFCGVRTKQCGQWAIDLVCYCVFHQCVLFPDLTQWLPSDWPLTGYFLCSLSLITLCSFIQVCISNPSSSDSLPTPSSHSPSETFFGTDSGRIGGRYQKVLYKEYTDDTFTTAKPRSPDSEHLGLLGMVSLYVTKVSSFLLCGFLLLMSAHNISQGILSDHCALLHCAIRSSSESRGRRYSQSHIQEQR